MQPTKTSAEWFKEVKKGTVILDYDGWDRMNLDFSWNEEKITEYEFTQRLCSSTIICTS